MGDILPDILEPNLRVVFCGMAAGTASAAKGAYYAGPGNKFWPTLFNLGIIPVQLSSQEFRQVTRYGIGLV
jgi:TDG/mug DNA glycosylase family protein